MDKETIEALLEAQTAMFKAANLMLAHENKEARKHGMELWRAGLMIDDWWSWVANEPVKQIT